MGYSVLMVTPCIFHQVACLPFLPYTCLHAKPKYWFTPTLSLVSTCSRELGVAGSSWGWRASTQADSILLKFLSINIRWTPNPACPSCRVILCQFLSHASNFEKMPVLCLGWSPLDSNQIISNFVFFPAHTALLAPYQC